MAGRKKTSKRGKKRAAKKHSYKGLTRAQLIARLRAATKASPRHKKTGRRKARGLTYRQKVKYGMVSSLPEGYLEKAQAKKQWQGMANYFDSSGDKGGRRRKKAKKGAKRGLSAWQRFIKSNKNRRGMRKKNGMLNLRALAVAYHKSPAGKKAAKKTARKPKRHAKRGAKKRSSRRDYGWY
jgi:hypothetical protein